MTLLKITTALTTAGKPLKRAQLYRCFSLLNIKPAVRQRPARYPLGTEKKILAHYGIGTAATLPRCSKSIVPLGFGIPSMKQLRAERSKVARGSK